MHGPSEPSPPAGLLRVDELIDRFEDEWANGQRPVIARFLQQAPGGALDATQLALELCVIDLCARWRFSCSNEGDSDNNDDFPLRPFTEDYLARFPEVAQDGLAPLALVREEYVARVTCDGPVDHQEYVDRFPQIADSLLRSLREFDRSEQQTKLRAELQKLARNQRQQFLDDYEVLERLGTGGMGIVYRARQISLNRIVALKTIRRGEFASDQEVQRFLAEARTVATLDHPNIVSVYDVGSQDGQHYYAMAYVEGDSLAELIRCGPLPAREAATLCYKLTLGVEYAHSRNHPSRFETWQHLDRP